MNVPDAHGKHELAPPLAAKVFIAHSVQLVTGDVPPPIEKLPAAHCVQLVPTRKKPESQRLHEVAPAVLRKGRVQFWHADAALALVKVFDGHDVQLVAPACANVPAGQTLHCVPVPPG